MTVKNRILMLALICMPSLGLAAQTVMTEVKKDSTHAPAGRDTLGARAGLSAPKDTIRVRWNEDSLIAARTATADTVMRNKKSATFAMLATMVLPGAGQIYNESYWKAPVVWGFGAYFYWAYHKQDQNYKIYRDQYAASVYADSTHKGDPDLLRIRRSYYDDRNRFGWYIALTYLIAVVDAYVDASLYNFEVSPDLQPHGEWKATLHIRLR
jgi:hypothetical protein